MQHGPKDEFFTEPGGLETAYLRATGATPDHIAAARAAMTINWIGLWTIIRREMSRLMRVPIQAFVAPWISALLFIFIFGYVVGSRISTIGGHRYLEFVLPGILMLNVVNAAFLQSSSQIYFSRFLRYVEETLVSPLSYAEMIAGVLVTVIVRSVVTAVGILALAALFGAASVQGIGEFVFWVVGVSAVFGLLGNIVGPLGQELRTAHHSQRVLYHAAVIRGRCIQHDFDAAALSALDGVGQSVLLFHQWPAPFHDRVHRSPRGAGHWRDFGAGRHYVLDRVTALFDRVRPQGIE